MRFSYRYFFHGPIFIHHSVSVTIANCPKRRDGSSTFCIWSIGLVRVSIINGRMKGQSTLNLELVSWLFGPKLEEACASRVWADTGGQGAGRTAG